MILIIHTTQYRQGSDKFARIAKTMQQEIALRYPEEIISKGIVGKKELTQLFSEIKTQGKTIDEFHFIGHSGMYGPMYGTVQYPEQYSPYEIKNLAIPFTKNARAFFHCCRSARWFAPFFADAHQVETFGYHWYTTFSADKHTFKKVKHDSPHIYAAGCIGKKSHGWKGSVKKYMGAELEKMISFKPGERNGDGSYNQVAELYANAFTDIKVRADEWKWLNKHLPEKKNISVLDIGCGNGALLNALAWRVAKGTGIDVSSGILEYARKLNQHHSHLTFKKIEGPEIPVENHSVDVVISMLSFRYLDWDPLMEEIKRVLKPGGKVLIIDMVTVPVKWKEYPGLIKSKLHQYAQRYTQKKFHANLKKLVSHPEWKTMLKHNPIRAEHEMKWYLESRFPGKKVEKINIGWNSCILAFDSGNIENIKDIYLTYP